MIRLTENIPGDTAECGVYNGASSYFILKRNLEHKKYKRTHHMFDSFEGLSDPVEQDGEHWTKNDLTYIEKGLVKNLKPFKNYKIYKGWIPKRFKDVENIKFSFVHVDIDLYEPTKDSIEFFYDRLEKGAVFVCDDYGFDTCPGATKALDNFLVDKPEKMISLSGGAGFFIKGMKTLKNK